MEKDLGWVRRVGQRGSALKFKLTKFTGPQGDELRDRALLHGAAIDALASMHYDEDPLAELIATAGHSAWNYARARRSPASEELVQILGSRAWVAAVHHYATLPADEGLGLPKAPLARAKRQVAGELPAVFDRNENLLEALDAHARVSGAIVYRAERDALAEADAAVDRARISAFRIVNADRFAARKELAAVLRKAWSGSGVLGRIPEDTGELAAWTGQAAQIVAEGGLVVSDLMTAREFLANAVIYRGFDAAKASKVSAFVFRDAA
jgi:transposase